MTLTTTVLVAIPAGGEADPWPFWQRTATRLGNTKTIGPTTPTLDWMSQFSTDPFTGSSSLALVVDDDGRLIAGSGQGVAVLHPVTHKMIWEQDIGDTNGRPAIARDRVAIARDDPLGAVFCFAVATGEEIWSEETGGESFGAPVIAEDHVFVTDNVVRKILAYDLQGGEQLWSFTTDDAMFESPALDWPSLLTAAGSPSASGKLGIVPLMDVPLWTFQTGREIFGTAPIHAGRVYFASTDRWLYALDASTGAEVWRFWTEQHNRGAVCIGHDGTIYTGTTGNFGLLFAISPDGEQIWRREVPGRLVPNAPIVDGQERIYFTSSDWRVHAFTPDGDVLWSIPMPEDCRSSPTLGPDGTLYVLCMDNNLYAFRDSHVRATITDLQTTTGEILDGGIEELGEVDDAYLHTRSGFGNRVTDLHKMELVVSARVSDSQPEIMRIQIKSKIDHPSGRARVSLRNWQTGDLETIREYTIGLDDPFEWIQIPEGGNAPHVDPQRYIRPTGAIELQLKHTVFVPFLAFTFESFIDQVKIEVTG